MKKLILAIMLVAFMGCESEDQDPNAGTGCMTGIPKGQNYRVQIRCCTRQEFLAGNNVNAGGTSNWTSYTDHDWEKCSACN